MNSTEIQEIAARFGAVAQEFCNAVDAAEDSSRSTFLLRIYRVLPELISAALQLPHLAPSDSTESEDDTRLSSVAWERIYNAVGKTIGDWDIYWQLFDPTKNNEPGAASLADDLADIYRDVNDGIVANRKHSRTPQDVVWEWRFSFYSHWGKHAIDALQAIHHRASEILP
jgi:hypothetical protein